MMMISVTRWHRTNTNARMTRAENASMMYLSCFSMFETTTLMSSNHIHALMKGVIRVFLPSPSEIAICAFIMKVRNLYALGAIKVLPRRID